MLKIKIIDDSEDGFAEMEETLGDGDDIVDVAVVTGDFNGDGSAQIAVGIGLADGAELRFVQNGSGYSFDDARTKSYGLSFPDSTFVTLELASGNLDYDSPEELGVVVNEYYDPNFGGDDGTARFFVYDDGNTGFVELDSGPVQGQDGSVVSAVVADLDFGDVDGDGLDELMMGGLAEFETSCTGYDAFVTVRDDAEHAHAAIDTDTFDAFFSKYSAFGPWRLRFVHVGAFDLDGDGLAELHANLRVYEDLGSLERPDPHPRTAARSVRRRGQRRRRLHHLGHHRHRHRRRDRRRPRKPDRLRPMAERPPHLGPVVDRLGRLRRTEQHRRDHLLQHPDRRRAAAGTGQPRHG